MHMHSLLINIVCIATKYYKMGLWASQKFSKNISDDGVVIHTLTFVSYSFGLFTLYFEQQ